MAADNPPALAPVEAMRVAAPPVIDGVLDDAAWTGTPLPADDWRSYNPLHGDQIPHKTTVWVAYDRDALYFAFRCDDPQPAGIKTSITKRDNIWSDDWVGLSLDALGTGQVSYHLMVNPSGIQLDMINTISGYEDTSPDYVWESAGQVNERGYAVEIRLPLQSIRFKGGDVVNMGILFWRRISRIGVSVAWPALEPGKWVFDKHARLTFSNLDARQTREVIPSATFSRNVDRATPTRWNSADHTGDLGLSAKWGLTDTVTLDATVNPDFSQVESDAFQVEVNQRFPVYYSEKRPFFMEGAGIFNLAGNAQGDASMLYAVNTRNIVDPIFGAKLTGSVGRMTFGTLTAVDQSPGRTDDPLDPLRGKEKLFQVARAQFSVNPGSYVGAMATFTNLDDRRNAVAGGDFNLKLTGSQRLSAFVLGSTTDRDEGGRDNGLALQANYSFNSRRVNFSTQVEHYDRAFVMDTAFLNRTGITNAWVYGDYNFYPDKDKHPWIRRITPFAYVQGGRDRVQDGDEYIIVTGGRMSFTRQGFFRSDVLVGQEPWQGREFEWMRWRMFGNVQLFRWLRPYVNVNFGDAVYYDEVDPFLGYSVNTSVGGTFQPSGRFSQGVEFTRIAFDRPSTGERVYTVNLLNTRSTFQFTKALAARAIVQYDSNERRVLTDFLGSYEPRPGTVLYAGYGSLYEKRGYQNDQWLEGEGTYLTTRRGLFLKASYLYRF